MLAAIVEKATGMPIDQFASKFLFTPLGINDFTWVKRRDGIPITASGLRLRSRDFLKFGIMYLNGGQWNGKQIISSSSIEQVTKKHILTPFEMPKSKSWLWVSNMGACLYNGERTVKPNSS